MNVYWKFMITIPNMFCKQTSLQVEIEKDVSWGEDILSILLNKEYYGGLKG